MAKEGLFYRTATGKEIPYGKDAITLTVELSGDCCTIRNYFDGKRDESYQSTSKERATVDMVALLNGFQPPRRLDRRDIPSQ